jgi:hypothetical protein
MPMGTEMERLSLGTNRGELRLSGREYPLAVSTVDMAATDDRPELEPGAGKPWREERAWATPWTKVQKRRGWIR